MADAAVTGSRVLKQVRMISAVRQQHIKVQETTLYNGNSTQGSIVKTHYKYHGGGEWHLPSKGLMSQIAGKSIGFPSEWDKFFPFCHVIKPMRREKRDPFISFKARNFYPTST